MRAATGDFANAVNVSVYFKQDVSLDKARQLAASLRQRSGVASVGLVSADEALKSFRERSGFGEALDALGTNPLPHALDVRPDTGAMDAAQMDALRRYIAAWPEVELVQVDSEWVRPPERDSGPAAWNRYRRRNPARPGSTPRSSAIRFDWKSSIDGAEIEVSKLVGGSHAFVRRPFLYTGLYYGLAGGVVATLLVLLGLSLLNGPVTRLAESYGSPFRLLMPGVTEVAMLVAAGGFLGLAGASLAAARHLARIEPRA